MDEATIPALNAPAPAKDNPLTRSKAGLAGMVFLGLMLLACVATLPWTLSGPGDTPRYNAGAPQAGRLPPAWWVHDDDDARRLNRLVDAEIVNEIAADAGLTPEEAIDVIDGDVGDALRAHWPTYVLGTDVIGRDLFVRLLTGGGISLAIGLSAAFISVLIGTVYGSIAAYAGGKIDAVMMRIVDILFGLPYILLVVLLAVASDAVIDEHVSRSGARAAWVSSQAARLADRPVEDWLAAPTTPAAPELVDLALEAMTAQSRAQGREGPVPTRADADSLVASYDSNGELLRTVGAMALPARRVSAGMRTFYDVVVLLVAIGGVSWLTMARVVRGQVLSLKAQPFMEAARAIGVPLHQQFLRHLLPNLVGPIIVYATLTVPQAILQESFLSFLGIGVKPPLPSWGNLAADGLSELNQYRSHWWLLLFPCLLLGTTLLALNFVGEGLREAMDPKRRKGRT